MSLKSFQEQNIEKIKSGDMIDRETIPIVGYLLKMNINGFITVESQPYKVEISHNKSKIISRAYVNGFYPSFAVNNLVAELINLDPSIIVCETIYLNKNGNKNGNDLISRKSYLKRLQLYNVTEEDLIFAKESIEKDDFSTDTNIYYPMSEHIVDEKSFFLSGYSGNLTLPNVDYINDDGGYGADKKHSDQVVKNMSLIEIFSKNINNALFPTIVAATSILSPDINNFYHNR